MGGLVDGHTALVRKSFCAWVKGCDFGVVWAIASVPL